MPQPAHRNSEFDNQGPAKCTKKIAMDGIFGQRARQGAGL